MSLLNKMAKAAKVTVKQEASNPIEDAKKALQKAEAAAVDAKMKIAAAGMDKAKAKLKSYQDASVELEKAVLKKNNAAESAQADLKAAEALLSETLCNVVKAKKEVMDLDPVKMSVRLSRQAARGAVENNLSQADSRKAARNGTK